MPGRRDLLVETFPRGGKHFLVAYCFEGRNAHQTLGMLLTRRLERARLKPLGFVANEYALAVWGLSDLGLRVSRGELFAIMVPGMASIAGTVLFLYLQTAVVIWATVALRPWVWPLSFLLMGRTFAQSLSLMHEAAHRLHRPLRVADRLGPTRIGPFRERRDRTRHLVERLGRGNLHGPRGAAARNQRDSGRGQGVYDARRRGTVSDRTQRRDGEAASRQRQRVWRRHRPSATLRLVRCHRGSACFGVLPNLYHPRRRATGRTAICARTVGTSNCRESVWLEET